MHFSTLLPVSISLLTTVYAQTPPLPAVSINVVGSPGAAASPGVGGAPLAASSALGGAPAAASSALGAAPAASTGSGVIGNGGVPVWVVKVGSPNNDLIFAPNTIVAKPGDMVQFQFYSRNHSVATSTFDQPCVPQMMANPPVAANAFWSGFMPTEGQGMLTYTVPVRDTNPIWFYCSQAKHCQGGMVGVVNPPTNSPNTLQAFAAKAATVPESISPNGGAMAGVPGTPPGGGIIGGTGTTSGGVAQTTRSAASTVIRRGCWELAAAALAVVMLL